MVLNDTTIKMIHFDPLETLKPDLLSQTLIKIRTDLNFDIISATLLENPLTLQFYKDWLSHGYQAEMQYLEKHLKFKEQPRLLNPSLNSAITFAQSYLPQQQALSIKIPARTAFYAQNKDYHFWLKDKLSEAIKTLEQIYPEEIFIPYVDSGPIHERDLAYKAGLGWFGKNTCIIHSQKGSFFFLAEILTSLKINNLNPLHEDLCGKCNLCIESCPTQALEKNKVLNAEKCISFLTIESKKTPPLELREKMNDWFFGCDICQTVCPWNNKKLKSLFINKALITAPQSELSSHEKSELIYFFKDILTSSNKKIQKRFIGTPYLRSGGFGLKRNALIVIANRQITELLSEVESLCSDPKLGELAKWTKDKLINN